MKQKKKISEKEFQLLLTFLSERNEATVALVKNQLKTALQDDPAYHEMVRHLADPYLKTQAEMLLGEFWFEKVLPQFKNLLAHGPNLDLEKGAVLLATIQYPELKLEEVSKKLDKMAEEAYQIMMEGYPLPTKPIHDLGRYLFKMQGFKGNEKNYNDPDNSFINKVLERRTGIPIGLSVVYMLLAKRLNLIVHGIGLPGHFIVGHRVPRGVVFVDPFNGGRILRKKDCEVLVRRLGFYFKEEFLDPVSPIQIMQRMMANLINIYSEQGAMARAHWLAQLYQLF